MKWIILIRSMDDLVAKSKGELLKDDKARWNALAEAEKNLNWSRRSNFSYVRTKYSLFREAVCKRHC